LRAVGDEHAPPQPALGPPFGLEDEQRGFHRRRGHLVLLLELGDGRQLLAWV
jgi:hypothetical protein